MRVVLFFGLMIFSLSMNAQLEPVNWSVEAEKVGEAEYDIVFTAKIDKGWAVYSPHLESLDGPVPTSFEFENQDLEAIGKVKEAGNRKEMYDELFEMNLVKFSGKARFTQRIKVENSETIKGYLTYMTCNEESCLPPKDVEFEIMLNE